MAESQLARADPVSAVLVPQKSSGLLDVPTVFHETSALGLLSQILRPSSLFGSGVASNSSTLACFWRDLSAASALSGWCRKAYIGISSTVSRSHLTISQCVLNENGCGNPQPSRTYQPPPPPPPPPPPEEPPPPEPELDPGATDALEIAPVSESPSDEANPLATTAPAIAPE